MASLIKISPAMEEDFPVLAHIAAVAMSVDLVHRIIYEGNNPLDTSRQERSVMAELNRAASNPEAHICKAVLKSSKEIVGYSLFRFEDDSKSSALPVKPPPTSFLAGTNARFLERMTSGVRAVHKKHMAGKRHVCESLHGVALLSGFYISFKIIILSSGWTHLMVLPSFQRNGIGSALFRHGFENLGADEVPIWIVTQMRGRAMYLKFGFQDLDVIDVDLSEYAGPWQGFGVHRNICMLRQPGGVANCEAPTSIAW